MKIVHAYNESIRGIIGPNPNEYVTLLKDDSAFEEEQLRKDLEADGYEVTVFYYELVQGSRSDMFLPFMTPLVAK